MPDEAVLDDAVPGSPVSGGVVPTGFPRQLVAIPLVALATLLVAMVVAAAVGGVNWLIGIGGGGTALGTLGLAFFTYAMAERTTELVGSSQRLETAATQELSAGNRQAQAAAATALEAEKSRIDALAPIVDFRVGWEQGTAVPRNVSNPQPVTLSQAPGQHPRLDEWTFAAFVRLTLFNFGRTPAFVTFTHLGAGFQWAGQPIRVDPGDHGEVQITAELPYNTPEHNPFDAREIRFEMRVRGAMTGRTIDQITWVGGLTLLERTPPQGWHLHPDPVKMTYYNAGRDHGLGSA